MQCDVFLVQFRVEQLNWYSIGLDGGESEFDSR
jgi:hypothetical protein